MGTWEEIKKEERERGKEREVEAGNKERREQDFE